MGYEAKKTEHSGAKHGNGAYWGRKKDAKKESNKIRRRNTKEIVRKAFSSSSPKKSRLVLILKSTCRAGDLWNEPAL